MFKLYQNMNKKDENEGRRDQDLTGHDRFCRERPGARRKRRPVNRRTQSAIELDSEAIINARGALRRGRSASIEEDESEEEKGYQLTNKIDSLAKILFNRVSATRNREQHEMSRRTTWHSNSVNPYSSRNLRFSTVIRRWKRKRNDSAEFQDDQAAGNCRKEGNAERNGRHLYTALDHGPSAGDGEDAAEYVEMERRSRDRALTICQAYLQGAARYNLIKQLSNVGSRVDKHWFSIRDVSLKADRLLTLAPANRNCPISICSSTKDTLNHLFLALQHPYVCPVLDLDFVESGGLKYVILVQPINQGSLKDLIYGIERNCWNEDWGQKYGARGKGLPLPQVQRLGRQILEALMFLKERGFPTVTHLHSGNVVVQNGAARLAGLENTLLGFTSRIYPVVTARSSHAAFIDTICFGHMLFEMCAGYELCSLKPTSAHLSDLDKYPQIVEILELIFEKHGTRYPGIEELLLHDLFRNIDLREMRSAPVTIFRPILTPSIQDLLNGIKRQNSAKRLTSTDSADMISLKSPTTKSSEKEDRSLLAEIYNELSSTTI